MHVICKALLFLSKVKIKPTPFISQASEKWLRNKRSVARLDFYIYIYEIFCHVLFYNMPNLYCPDLVFIYFYMNLCPEYAL
uniref:Uncharacterized protein n=1 Tax=Pyxicephalus adspersus TaxID=30357 RepID=A0AAV3ARJ8_PYXAD|nr:TPA: hypothetical protein GDO54_001667 [Pyxicephalus adspersus]